MTFRKATLSDVPTLNILVNTAYRGESAKLGWTTEADLIDGTRTDEASLIEMIADPMGHMELAIEDDLIIGCIYLHKDKDILYFGMLTVQPGQQGKGLGSILLKRGEDLGKSWGMKSTRMTVISERPELIEYYERRGFTWNGETEPFPDHDPKNGKPRKKLTFKVYVKNLVSN